MEASGVGANPRAHCILAEHEGEQRGHDPGSHGDPSRHFYPDCTVLVDLPVCRTLVSGVAVQLQIIFGRWCLAPCIVPEQGRRAKLRSHVSLYPKLAPAAEGVEGHGAGSGHVQSTPCDHRDTRSVIAPRNGGGEISPSCDSASLPARRWRLAIRREARSARQGSSVVRAPWRR